MSTLYRGGRRLHDGLLYMVRAQRCSGVPYQIEVSAFDSRSKQTLKVLVC